MNDLLSRASVLHTKATALLEALHVRELFAPYGEVVIGGSYLYNLMTHPDIDVSIINKATSKESCAELVKKLAALKVVKSLKVIDRVHHPRSHDPARPTGYYIGLIIPFKEEEWNVDIWLQQPEWHTDQSLQLAQELMNISMEQRLAILSIKSTLRARDEYGVNKKYQSVDVYRSVLDHGTLSAEAFLAQHQG